MTNKFGVCLIRLEFVVNELTQYPIALSYDQTNENTVMFVEIKPN